MKKIITFSILLLSTLTFLRAQINIDSSLVAYFTFSNNVIDSSDFNNNGDAYQVAFATDRFGNQLSSVLFDGIDDLIDIPVYEEMSPKEELTVSAWIKTDEAPGPVYTAIYDRLESSDGFGLVIRPDGTIRFSINGGLGIATSTKKVLDNKWHFVVGTYNVNDGEIKVYVDCNLEGTSNYDKSIDYKIEPRNSIGGPGGLSQSYYKGLIDDLRVYSRSISGEEVAELCSDINTSTIKTLHSEIKYKISPNPATNQIVLESIDDQADNQEFFYQIFDQNGKLVFNNYGNTKDYKRINIECMSRGIYYVRIIEEQQIGSLLFVKQ